MGTELQPLPDHRDIVRALDSKELFRKDVDEFVNLVWQERERRLRAWARAHRPQAWIAEEVGRDQRTIGRWQKRFGIKPSQRHAPHRRKRHLQIVAEPEVDLGIAPKSGKVEPEPHVPTDEGRDLDPSQWADDLDEPGSDVVSAPDGDHLTQWTGRTISTLIFDLPEEDGLEAFRTVFRAMMIHLSRHGSARSAIRAALGEMASDLVACAELFEESVTDG
jgi:hypothetical protein